MWSSSTWLAILQYAGAPAVSVVAYLGTRYTQRQAVKAQERTAQIEDDKADALAFTAAREIWQSAVETLKSENDAKSQEISNLRVEASANRAEIEHFSRGFSSRGHTIDLLQEYIRTLLKFIRKHRLTPPPVPEGVDVG